MAIKGMKTITFKAIGAFFITFALCMAIVSISIVNRMSVERLTMEQLITEKSVKANEGLSKLLYKAHTLAALVLQDDGGIENFDRIAASIVDDPAILNVLIAPDGVVSNVYPLQGNEAVIGLNYFSEGAGNKEAILAKESRQLVFGGPFESVQGGSILVGRLPVFVKDDESGDERFWGLVSVTLRYPQALNSAGLNELWLQGFAYEIWRVNPDTGEHQIITGSEYQYKSEIRYLEKNVTIHNAEWVFRILPVRAWYEYPDTWLLVFLGLFISLLIAFVVQNNDELKLLKVSLENMSYTDSLTDIYNRRYFMDIAVSHIERAIRANGNAYIIVFDLDHFKKINDTHGHLSGDEVLKTVAQRVKAVIRPYDLFARFGGEEFIILVTDIDRANLHDMAERIRQTIMQELIKCGDMQLQVTASFGIASVNSADGLIKSIDVADKALYAAKNKGRNRIVIQENGD